MEEKKFDIKAISERILKASQDGYSDYEIDEALYKNYPQLLNKGSYDGKSGDYIPGSSYREFLLEVEREKRPRGTSRYFANVAHNFLDTATFGMGKRIAALLGSAIYDREYDDVYNTLTEEENKFSELRPADAMAAKIGGAFTPGPKMVAEAGYNILNKTPFLGNLLKPKVGETGKNILKETTKSVPVAMGESVLYTAGTSGSMDEFKERVGPEAISTGVGSAGLTPVMMGVGKGLGAGARFAKSKLKGEELPPGVSRTDDDRALEVLSNARKAGATDEQIKSEIARIREIDPDLANRLTQMDVAGDSFLPPTMAAAQTPGQAFSESAKNIKPFFKEQVERLQKFSAKTLLKSDSVASFRAKKNSERIKAGKLYDKLWSKPSKKKGGGDPVRTIVGTEKKTTVKFDEGSEQTSLAAILDPNKPTVQMAMKAAQQLADEARVILPPPGVNGFDAEHLHFIKMGFDEILTKFGPEGLSGGMRMGAYKNLKRLTSLMDSHVKGYKDARNAYAVPTAENRAFTEGYNSMKNSIAEDKLPEMIGQRFKDFSGHEKEAYKAGAANYLDQLIEQGMDSLSMTNKGRKLSQISLIKKVRSIWGDDVANKYKNFMEQHAEMLMKRSTVSPLTGSLTGARSQADKVLDFSEPPGGAIPLSTNEALRAGLNRKPNTQAAEDMSRGAAEALAPRLTLPGESQIMKNQADIAAWEKLQRLKEKAEATRRGAVPGMLSPMAQPLSDQYGPK